MIDPIQLPILLKAIDFVFEEGHKILEERRQRRTMQNHASENEAKESPTENALLKPEKAVEIKQDLIATKVDEILWHNHEQELEHLVRLLDIYSRNYYLAREQYAKWGDALVPPIIVNNLMDAENSIVETVKKLEIVLSKIYRKELHPIQ